MQRINDAGYALLREFEQKQGGGGPALFPYRCPAGKLTIGWGHTGPDVYEGMRITPERAGELLEQDVAKFEAGVSKLLTFPASDNEFSAMVCLAFNIGLGAKGFAGSTVLRKHNAGDYAGAATAFALWNKGTNDQGKLVELRGLTRRRAAEAALYLKPDPDMEEVDPQRTRAADVEARPAGASNGTVASVSTVSALGTGGLVAWGSNNPDKVFDGLSTLAEKAPLVLLVLVILVAGYVGYRAWSKNRKAVA